MKNRIFTSIFALLLCSLFQASATVYYVNAGNANPTPPYTSWLTAATNIQDAAALALYGDTVLVTNGIYQYGGTLFNGSNRVRVVDGAALQSVNGPAVTTIVGYQVPGTTNGNNAVRCVYLSEFSTMSGFTLTNGATPSITSGFGGGVVLESSCTVSNCIIVNNAAAIDGGGCYSPNGSPIINCWIGGNNAPEGGGAYGGNVGILVNCIVTNNSAGSGSGVAVCKVYDSLLTGNGQQGGGSAAYLSTLYNCTLAGNTSVGLGAADGCTLVNSIIYDNHNGFYADCYQCLLTNCCTPLGAGTSSLSNGSISNAPGFVNPSGDFHLNGWSRCIGAGNTAWVTNNTDLDGNPRIVNGAVDMGCYENLSPFQGVAHYVSLNSTNPVPPYTNWPTAATNIQNAVAVAQNGEYVIADDGVYTTGSTIVYGSEANRVALTNGITLLSAGGAQAAIIAGAVQTRCAYVGSNSLLVGFTLTNGQASSSGDVTNEQSGGGVWCATGGVVSNCVIADSQSFIAARFGGGIFGGTIYNSTITNTTYSSGGAAALATLYNCTVISNSWQLGGGNYGGGLYFCTASNCLIVGNEAYFGGAGAYQSVVYNSTIKGNTTQNGSGAGAYQSQLYGCSLLTNIVGGGAYLCYLTNCILDGNHGNNGASYQCTNYYCTFSGNSGSDGGGVNGGISYGCTFIGNTSPNGGGAQNGTFYNCLFTGNTANSGGGAYNSILYNCTVVGNTATNTGGGVSATGGSINNSIVYYNQAPTGPNWYGAKFNYSCTTPTAPGVITNAPVFVNMAAGDFHEQTNSPSINDGSNAAIGPAPPPHLSTTDLDGNPRIVGGTVDIGAYEYQGSNYNLLIPIQWLAQYGLPTDGSVDYVDSDGTGMNNWQKWIAGLNPTNPASVLAMSSPVPTNNPSGITVTWQSVTNRSYFLQSSTNLAGQPAFETIQSNIAGQAGTTSYTDTGATNSGPYFYRIGVQ